MARPRVANAEDGLQIWESSSEYTELNSRGQPTRGGPPAWGLDEEILLTAKRKQLVTKCDTGSPNWMDCLE